jgi:hypothetical protein
MNGAQRVKHVCRNVERKVLNLRRLARPGVLTLQGRRFDVATSGRCREDPWSVQLAAAHFENSLRTLGQGHAGN